MIEIPDGHGKAGVTKHPLYIVRLKVLPDVRSEGVPKPVRMYALLDPSLDGEPLEKVPYIGVTKPLPRCGLTDDAEVGLSNEAEFRALELPTLKNRRRPGIYGNHPALVALSVKDSYPAGAKIYVLPLKRERFTDPQSRAPQGDDQRTVADPRRPAAARIHKCVDLVGGEYFGWKLPALVRWLAPYSIRGKGHGGTMPPASVEQRFADQNKPRHHRGFFCTEHGFASVLAMVRYRCENTGNPLICCVNAAARPQLAGILTMWGRRGSRRPAPGRQGANRGDQQNIREAPAYVGRKASDRESISGARDGHIPRNEDRPDALAGSPARAGDRAQRRRGRRTQPGGAGMARLMNLIDRALADDETPEGLLTLGFLGVFIALIVLAGVTQ